MARGKTEQIGYSTVSRELFLLSDECEPVSVWHGRGLSGGAELTPLGEGGGEHRAEPVPPEAHGLVAHIDAALVQQVLDVAQRDRQAHVEHHRQAADLRAGLEGAERARLGHRGRVGCAASSAGLVLLTMPARAPDGYAAAALPVETGENARVQWRKTGAHSPLQQRRRDPPRKGRKDANEGEGYGWCLRRRGKRRLVSAPRR